MSVTYLSTEWVEAADALLSAVTIEPPIEGPPFSIETIVTGPSVGARTAAGAGTAAGTGAQPEPEQRYVVEFSGSSMSARRPRAGEVATVRFTQTYAVAVAVARGIASAQAAFLAADIQVGGDISTLINHAGLVAQLGDVLAPLRIDTVFAGID